MQISIIYATYSNSTGLATELLETELTKMGHVVSRAMISTITSEALQQTEFLVLASPSWDYQGQQGMPHEDFTKFHEANPDLDLNGKPIAIMGLGDSSFTFFCGAVDHLTEWFESYGALTEVEPLKIDQYYFNESAAKSQVIAWATEVDAAAKRWAEKGAGAQIAHG